MNRADAPYLPLSPDVIAQHSRGEVHIGLYPLGDDDTCWWVAADFDKEAAMLDALAFMKAARVYKVPAALEVSQSGRGAHVWIFSAQATSAATARHIATNPPGEAFQLRGSMHLSSYDRSFPSQDVHVQLRRRREDPAKLQTGDRLDSTATRSSYRYCPCDLPRPHTRPSGLRRHAQRLDDRLPIADQPARPRSRHQHSPKPLRRRTWPVSAMDDAAVDELAWE
jgi:hypothetical protein